MSIHPPRNVLVAISIAGASGRDCLSGILMQSNAGLNWRIHLVQDVAKITDDLAGADARPDGIITEYPADPAACRTLEGLGLPVVFTNFPEMANPRHPRASFIRLDDEAVGARAADYLSKLGGFGSWVFATDKPGAKHSVLRHRGFVTALSARRIPVRQVTVPLDRHLPCEVEAIKAFLRELPRPIALYAARDYAALTILDICKEIGLKVPTQIAILGTDNDEVLCSGSSPQLSSILPNHRELGRFAVRELQRLMNGGRGRNQVLADSVMGIIPRDSTRPMIPAEHLIRSALAFIEQTAEKGITVQDVVRHLGVSRPLADLRFREIHGTSIGREIRKARLLAVQRRLTGTGESFSDIAAHCAFRDGAELARFFRRETGQTLSSWSLGNSPQNSRRVAFEIQGHST